MTTPVAETARLDQLRAELAAAEQDRDRALAELQRQRETIGMSALKYAYRNDYEQFGYQAKDIVDELDALWPAHQRHSFTVDLKLTMQADCLPIDDDAVAHELEIAIDTDAIISAIENSCADDDAPLCKGFTVNTCHVHLSDLALLHTN